jgi:hypothetical protein
MIDRYTKTMLTIIATCLALLCARNLLKPPIVQAQRESPVPVVVVGFNGAAASSGLLVRSILPLDVHITGQSGPLQVVAGR